MYGVQYGVYKEDRLTCKPEVIEGNEKTVGGALVAVGGRLEFRLEFTLESIRSSYECRKFIVEYF